MAIAWFQVVGMYKKAPEGRGEVIVAREGIQIAINERISWLPAKSDAVKPGRNF